MISENGGSEEEVRHRVGAGWGKWREMSGIVFDKRMPIMLKSAEYKTAIRPVPLHGSDSWTQRKAEQNLRERTDRRMLRRMMGIKRIEPITNECIRTRAGVANINQKI